MHLPFKSPFLSRRKAGWRVTDTNWVLSLSLRDRLLSKDLVGQVSSRGRNWRAHTHEVCELAKARGGASLMTG